MQGLFFTSHRIVSHHIADGNQIIYNMTISVFQNFWILIPKIKEKLVLGTYLILFVNF